MRREVLEEIFPDIISALSEEDFIVPYFIIPMESKLVLKLNCTRLIPLITSQNVAGSSLVMQTKVTSCDGHASFSLYNVI